MIKKSFSYISRASFLDRLLIYIVLLSGLLCVHRIVFIFRLIHIFQYHDAMNIDETAKQWGIQKKQQKKTAWR